MNALNTLLQLLLCFAVLFFFVGFITPHAVRFRLWRWSVGLIALVFLIALVAIEVRAHPLVASMIMVGASVLSFFVLELRRRHADRAHRPTPTPFLSLRATGKTAVDIDDDHPFASHEDGEGE